MLVHMAMCEYLHSTSPLPYPEQKQTTLTYQPHLTATSLTLLGQGPGVFQPIFMFLWIRFCVRRNIEMFSIKLPVIIAARQGITSTMINS